MEADAPVTFHLHIGYGKTGTSAIQRLLRTNAERLERQGILYVGLLFEEVSGRTGGRHLDAFFEADFDGRVRIIRDGITRAAEVCRRRGLRDVLWSWEPLVNHGAAVRRALETTPGVEPRVIVYVRRQDDWFQSAYLQWGVRHKTYRGPVRSFEDWYPLWRWRGDYEAGISAWSDGLDPAALIVRPYERVQLPDGLLADFLSLLPLQDRDEITVPDEDHFETLNQDLLGFVAAYNGLFHEERAPTELIRLLDRALLPAERGSGRDRVAFLSGPERRAIVAEFADSNRRLARAHLGRDELFLEPLPDDDAPYVRLAALEAPALARIMSQLVLYLDGEVRALRKEVEELKGRPD